MRILVVLVLLAPVAYAQPGVGMSKSPPLVGTGSSGSPLRIDPCPSGQAYVSNGTTWSCATAGDITSVGATAGGGLTGGGASGPVLLGLLTTCLTGEILKWNGSAWGCAADSTGDGGGDISGLTTGRVPVAASATSLVDSIISEASGGISVAGTSAAPLAVSTTSTATSVVAVSGARTDTATAGDQTVISIGQGSPQAQLIAETVNTSDLGAKFRLNTRWFNGSTYGNPNDLVVSGGSVGINQDISSLTYALQVSKSVNNSKAAWLDGDVDVVDGLTVGGAAGIGNSSGDAHSITGTLNANSTAGANGEVLKIVGGLPQWSTDADSGGDITGITTAGPLSGGCTSGTCALTTSMATARILGRTSASTGVAEQLTGTQVTAMLDTFTVSTKGLVPAASGGSTTTQYLRKDGTWATPPDTAPEVVQTTTSTGTVNDFALNANTTMLVVTSAGALTLTGMVASTDRCVKIINAGASVVDFAHDTGSTSTYRFKNSANAAWRANANETISACYTTSDSRWHLDTWRQLATLTVTTTSTLTGAVTMGSTATVTGATTLNGDVTVGDSSADALFVSSTTEFGANVLLSGPTLNVDSDSTFTGYVDARGTFGVSGTNPSISSGNCTITGEAQSFRITTTAEIASANACVVAFSRTFNSAPYCQVTPINSNAHNGKWALTEATTGITFTASGVVPNNAAWNVWCPDRR